MAGVGRWTGIMLPTKTCRKKKRSIDADQRLNGRDQIHQVYAAVPQYLQVVQRKGYGHRMEEGCNRFIAREFGIKGCSVLDKHQQPDLPCVVC